MEVTAEAVVAALSLLGNAFLGVQVWRKNRSEMRADRPDISVVFEPGVIENSQGRYLPFRTYIVNNAPRTLLVEELRLTSTDGVELTYLETTKESDGTFVSRPNRIIAAKGEMLEGIMGRPIYSSDDCFATIKLPEGLTEFRIVISIITSFNAARVRRSSFQMERQISIQTNNTAVCK